MSDNYIVINGKKTELSEEQLKALGIESVETKTNPFNRMGLGSHYYVPHFDGTARTFTEDNSTATNLMYRNSSYINDRAFAKQVALHQLLYRKLLKFAYDNGFEDTAEWGEILKPTCDNTCESTAEWSRRNQHYTVRYSYDDGDFVVFCQYDDKGQDVYFSSEKAAERAIEEVLKPFVKEHPEFVW